MSPGTSWLLQDGIRKNRLCIANWIKYAKWEESQQQLQRGRSVYERALDVDHRNISIWLQYAEFEMRSKQINHARNIWDRAVTIQPRVKQFWLKYSYMEEVLGNIPGARQVFERWMEWEPDEQAWQTYINFEVRAVFVYFPPGGMQVRMGQKSQGPKRPSLGCTAREEMQFLQQSGPKSNFAF